MATNGTDTMAELGLNEDVLRIPKADSSQILELLERAQTRKRGLENRAVDTEQSRSGAVVEAATAADSRTGQEFALAPLVNKIAYGIAKGLVVALKELEDHIASETRKVGDSVDRRLDTLQTTMLELSAFVGAQQSTNAAVEDHLKQIETRQAADIEALRGEARESESRQTANVDSFRSETNELWKSVSQRLDNTVAEQETQYARHSAALMKLAEESEAFSHSISDRIDSICKELGVHQEDIGALKTTLCAFSTRVDGLVERLDRQAETVRSMCSAYSQRETELEQLVDGLARLRSFPTPRPASGL